VLAIGLYTVGSYADKRRLAGSVVGFYVMMAVVTSSKPPDLNAAGAVWVSILFTAAAVAGYVAQHDRERRSNEAAERENLADAHTRRAQLVVANERLRIADELSTMTRSIHDIASHAGTGSQLVALNPVAARIALDAISTVSRDALNDLRRLVKHIRTDSEPTMYSPVASNLEPALAVMGESR
jgi:signal transduction histidine kinase